MFDEEKGKFVPGDLRPTKSKFEKQFMEYGEMSRQNAYEACWEYVHELKINEALESDDPLIQTLAVIDRSLSNQLKYASSRNIQYVIIVGPKELAENKVKLRNMKSGKEEVIELGEILKYAGN